VCPGRGAAAGLVLPVANAEAMALHLAEISAQVAPGAHAVVVLDGAGYHQAKALAGRVPANLSLLPLPPYSPELNPMELVWQDLRRRDLANRVFDDLGQVIEACCRAWNKPVTDTARLVSLTDFAWARPRPKTLYNWYQSPARKAGRFKGLPEPAARASSKFVSVGELAPAERSLRFWQVE
jgi:transposase